MNFKYDIIIIGDSIHGYRAVKDLAAASPSIKIAFISNTFKNRTTRDFLNVEYIRDEIIFTDYKNRLFGCYAKSGARFYCTNLIIATGLKYTPLRVGNKLISDIFNNVDDINPKAKYQPAVVLGDTNTDIKFALSVAKKYKQVYLCTKGINFKDATAANIKKLNAAENVVVLPNTELLKVVTKDGCTAAVELSNYSTVTCSAIFAKTACLPDTVFVSSKLINKDDKGYLKVNNSAESTVVPKCFAIGNCAEKYTNKKYKQMLETILIDL